MVDKKKIDALKSMLNKSNYVVFFGGAGVSVESGIPDFRSANGLYNSKYKYAPETILSHSFFYEHTKDFYDFYKNKMLYLNAKPNACHLKLAELEKSGKVKAVITQNIDDLHQKAGSKNVFLLHGTVMKNHCDRCGKSYDVSRIVNSSEIPYCPCGGIIKPDVVLYEEPLDQEVLEGAIKEIMKADMLIIGGTSLSVYPAASLIQYFHGKYLVIINKSTTSYDEYASLVIEENIGEVFKNL